MSEPTNTEEAINQVVDGIASAFTALNYLPHGTEKVYAWGPGKRGLEFEGTVGEAFGEAQAALARARRLTDAALLAAGLFVDPTTIEVGF